MAARLAWLGVVLTVFAVPYFMDGWWKFIPASLLLLALGYWRFEGEAPEQLGLSVPKNHLFLLLALLIATYFLSSYWGTKLLESNQVLIDSKDIHLGWVLFPLFQALNEEILFRSFLLDALGDWTQNKLFASVLSASGFVVAHAVFYPITQGGYLNFIALASLFCLSLALNRLYFRFAHIGFAFAIHAGWNLFQYGGNHFLSSPSGIPISEAELFNTIVGSPTVFAFCFLLWLSTLPLRTEPEKIYSV
jgi:membrane protease YdiL (CAAX protease family)